MQIRLSTPPEDTIVVSIPSERLPEHIQDLKQIRCHYRIDQYVDYYLLNLDVTVELNLTCMRCAEDFNYAYHRETEIALCNNELVADRIMSEYDPIVLNNSEVPFSDIIADDLHLFLPLKHLDEQSCVNNEHLSES